MSALLAKLKEKNGKNKMTRGEILALMPEKTYDDGRTKQTFRDETDINQIMKRAQVTGTISHLNKYEGRYGDFANFDFLGHQIMLGQAQTIFDDLPPEIRKEFHNKPDEFFEYVNAPENVNILAEKLPRLAEPGRQNLNVNGVITADAQKAAEAAAKPLVAAPIGAAAPTAPATTEAVKIPSADPPAA